MSGAASCQLLPWDCSFFGLKIGRIPGVCRDVAQLQAASQWAREQELDCVYALLDSSAPLLARGAAALGFELFDVRVTMKAKLASAQVAASGLREATARDVPALRAIASDSHQASRFYADPGFPLERCDALYAEWIERSVRHEVADAVFVADAGSEVLGYVTCSVDEQGLGNVGLFAVARQARGQGLSGRLLDAAFGWFRARGVQEVSVVTQGNNAIATTVYHRRGFVIEKTEQWHHAWPKRRS